MRLKRLKKQKKEHKLLKKVFVLILMFLVANQILTGLYDDIFAKTNISSEEFIKMLLSNSNHTVSTGYKSESTINGIIKFVSNIDLTNPLDLLSIKSDKAEPVDGEDTYNYEQLKDLSDYISDPYPADITKPIVYIYNSHQLENYTNKDLEVYNITPNVLMGAYLLKEKLNNLGVPTIVEDTNMADLMRVNGWEHADSYKASRILIMDKRSKYSTLKYYIDFHRDSIKHAQTTITIGGKDYARVLFVVGLENSNYKENLTFATTISNLINKKYPGLSKGILKKGGAGVDGVYNQDIDPDMMLMEVGGVENSIEEVLNTIEAFSICFKEFVGEDK